VSTNHLPQINVIIITWNNQEEITACLHSVQLQSYPNYKIIVVDNHSSDATVKIITREFPQITLLKNLKNLYYTGGINTGIKFSEKSQPADYYLILNPDTILDPNLLSNLVNRAISDPLIGVVGPKIKFLPQNANLIYSAGVDYDGFIIAAQIGHRQIDQGQFDESRDLNVIEGTCMLIKAAVIKKAGYFWEPLKMYSEDVEFCIRVKKAGFRVVYEPGALLYHELMKSTSQNKSINVKQLQKRNWLLIALRHYQWKSKLAMVKRYLVSGS